MKVDLDEVLAKLRVLEEFLRAEGSSAAADEVYALGCNLGGRRAAGGRKFGPRRWASRSV